MFILVPKFSHQIAASCEIAERWKSILGISMWMRTHFVFISLYSVSLQQEPLNWSWAYPQGRFMSALHTCLTLLGLLITRMQWPDPCAGTSISFQCLTVPQLFNVRALWSKMWGLGERDWGLGVSQQYKMNSNHHKVLPKERLGREKQKPIINLSPFIFMPALIFKR